jgi:hypothetical protein
VWSWYGKASIRSRKNCQAIIRAALVSSLTKASLDVRSGWSAQAPSRNSEQLKFAFLGAHLRYVDVNATDRVSFELRPCWFFPNIRQPADTVSLEQTMRRRSCQRRDGVLQRL